MAQGRIKRDDQANSRLILPRIGMIKIGMKNDKGYPQSVDYFIPTGKYAGMFTQVYGGKPQTIQIVFPDDDPAKVCNEKYEFRNDEGKLVAYGDGDTFQIWDGKIYKTLTVNEYPKLMESVGKRYPNKAVKRGEDGWSVTLTMNFIIPLVRGIAGVWQFVSKGNASTIPNIRDTFDGMIRERGFVKGIIWDMNVQFAVSQKPGDKSRYPVVSIVPNESEANVLKIKEAFKPINLLE